MISIYDIKTWSDVAAFLIWTLAVCAIVKALFGSFIAAELQYRLSFRDAPRRQRMNRLNWEINNRAAWDEDVARRSPHAAKQPLSDADIESRRTELQQFGRTSMIWRAFTYFMGCFACQAFWCSLVLYGVTRDELAPLAAVLTAASYSGASTMMAAATRVRGDVDPTARRGPPACKSCGK